MRIREFHIDRFGVLSNQLVSGLPPGISVFLGDNEAGKSTCLNFFRAMLFGYARARRSIDYAADSKTLSGGSLLLDSKDFGPVRLIRRPGPHGGPFSLSGPDGSPRPAGDLNLLLRGCTAELYDRVFAFSLDELVQLGDGKDERVRHALHGAAFGTGLRSPGQVLKELEDAMRRIFAPKAVSSRIHQMLNELETVQQELDEKGSEVARYGVLQDQLAELDAALEAEKRTRRDLEREQRDQDRRLALQRRWESLREAERNLAALPVAGGVFSPDGRERLDALVQRLEDRRIALATAQDALDRLERDMAARAEQANPACLAAHDALMALRERKESVRRAAAQMPELAREQAALAAQLAQARADLGEGWDEARVAAFAPSLALREACSRLGRDLGLAEQRAAVAEDTLGRLQRETNAAQNALRSVLEPGEGAAHDLPAEAAVERLNGLLSRATDAHGQMGALALRLRDAGLALDAALAAVHPDWKRQHLEQAMLSPADRGRLSALAASLLKVEDAAAEAGWNREDAEKTLADLRLRTAGQTGNLNGDGLRSPHGLTLLAGGLTLAGGMVALYAGLVSGSMLMAWTGGGQTLLSLSLLGLGLVLRDRNSGRRNREKAEQKLAAQRLAEAAQSQEEALGAARDARKAWVEALTGAMLPPDMQPGDLPLTLEKIDAAQTRRLAYEGCAAAVRDGEEKLDACLAFSRTFPALADQLASLPEIGSGLAPEPGPWLEAVRQYSTQCREAARLRMRRGELVQERQARLGELRQALAQAEKDLETARDVLAARQSAWQQWLKEQGLSPVLSVETARLALDAAGKAKNALEQMERLAARRGGLVRELAAFARDLEVHALALASASPALQDLQTLARKPEEPSSLAAVLSLLDELVAGAASARSAELLRRGRESEKPLLVEALSQAKAQVLATETEMAELLRLGGCDSAEAYRRDHGLWQQREQALAVKNSLAVALEQEASAFDMPLPALLASLAASGGDDPVDLAEQGRAREEALLQAAAREQALAERRGGLAAAMTGLLNEEGLTALLARRESLREEIRRAGDEWSRLALAKELLLRAKRRFESERQTGVVRKAGTLFNLFTGGAYTGITVSLDDESVLAVSRTGEAKNPESALSRGTREQLYLALRLAYAHDHGLQAEPLPVIMDDILVNFDAGRAGNVAEALAAFATENQVLFFTCHTATADLLAAAAPGSARFTLQGGTFSAAG